MFSLYLKWSLLIAIKTLFISCSFFFPREDEVSSADYENAKFIVDEVVAQVEESQTNGFPTEITIRYSTCFKDKVRTDNSIPNTEFIIHFLENFKRESFEGIEQVAEDAKKEDENLAQNIFKNSQCTKSPILIFSEFSESEQSCLKIQTDSKGCVSWTEVYPYLKPSEHSVWFPYMRVFEKKGTGGGVSAVPLEVNFWLGQGMENSVFQFLDTRFHKRKKASHLATYNIREQIPQCEKCHQRMERENLFARVLNYNIQNKDLTCTQCLLKKYSLTDVVDNYSEISRRPRLWIDQGMLPKISERKANYCSPTQEDRKLFKKLGICPVECNNSGLVIRENKSSSDCDPRGRILKVNLHIPLKIRMTNHMGAREHLLLTRGQYFIEPWFYLKTRNGKHISLHRKVQPVLSELIQGTNTLRVNFHLHIPYENYGLPVFLGLKIKENKDRGESAFLPFEGLFAFDGEMNKILDNKEMQLDEQTIAFYSEKTSALFDKNAESSPQNAQSSSRRKKAAPSSSLIDSLDISRDLEAHSKISGFRKAGWDVVLKRLRHQGVINGYKNVHVKSNGEASVEEKLMCPTAVSQTISYIGEVCFNDPLKREDAAKSTPMIVKIKSLDEVKDTWEARTKIYEHTSTSSGCLQWEDTLYFHWYDRQRYYRKEITFSDRYGGFEGKIKVKINPWNWGFLFFQDVTQLKKNGSADLAADAKNGEERSAVESPRLLVESYFSQFFTPQYIIDRLLNLHILRRLAFLLEFKVDRPDDIGNAYGGIRNSASHLRRGFYNVYVVLFKAHTEESGAGANLISLDQEPFTPNTFKSSSNLRENTNMGLHINRTSGERGNLWNTGLEYITHYKTLAHIRNGFLNMYLQNLFHSGDFIYMGSNLRLLAYLVPTDPKKYVYEKSKTDKSKSTCNVDIDKSTFISIDVEDTDFKIPAFITPYKPGLSINRGVFKAVSHIEGQPVTPQLMEALIAKGETQNQDQTLSPTIEGMKKQIKTSLANRVNRQVPHVLSQSSKQNWNGQVKTLPQGSQYKFNEMEKKLSGLIGSLKKRCEMESSNLQNEKIVLDLSINRKKRRILDYLNQDILPYIDKVAFPVGEQKPSDEGSRFTGSHLQAAHYFWLFGLKNRLETPVLEEEYLDPDLRQLGIYSCDLHQELQAEYEDFKKFRLNPSSLSKWGKTPPAGQDTRADFVEPAVFSREVAGFYAHKTGLTPLMAEEESGGQFVKDLDRVAKDLKLIAAGSEGAAIKDVHLFDGDTNLDFRAKMNSFNWPDYFDKNTLNEVMDKGIHIGTYDDPDVAAFMHFLCGFWFDKFYREYFDSVQLEMLISHITNDFNYRWATEFYKGLEPEQKEPILSQLQNLRGNALGSVVHIDPFVSEESGSLKESSYFQSLHKKDRDNHTSLVKNSMNIMGVGGMGVLRMNDFSSHPFYSCMSNPYGFFQIEKKMIIAGLKDGVDYLEGYTHNLNEMTSHDYSHGLNWSEAISRSISAKGGASLGYSGGAGSYSKIRDLFLMPLKFLLGLVSVGVDWSTQQQRQDSEASRRQKTIREGQALYLNLSVANFQIPVTQYRQCMVIKPNIYSFIKYYNYSFWNPDLAGNIIKQYPFISSGLFLCSDLKDASSQPLDIRESYYYVYQSVNDGLGRLIDPYNSLNRPFEAFTRGLEQWQKLGMIILPAIEGDKEAGVEQSSPFRPMSNPYFYSPVLAKGVSQALKTVGVGPLTVAPGVYSLHPDDRHIVYSRSFAQDIEEDRGWEKDPSILEWSPFWDFGGIQDQDPAMLEE